MAKVIPLDQVIKGGTYWEECVFGTSTFEVTVEKRPDDIVVLTYKTSPYGESGTAKCGTSKFLKNREFRYWDENPTDDEREATEWNGMEQRKSFVCAPRA